ncbi:MAG: 30S ribosomal protein S8 [Buchnera aphidicola (Periphyllus lyropictus)]|uniref:30S ribosomal protein S8 n=1 Tax=Buchnera aphidicola TaxID=9 RepID=UPI001EBDED9D|nr:30S ribosomal protein S8 [Buchnera aphidicola]NIH16487.1 30S ribosomal protein S8 [Buchnera aphidicola (Periphyllus lyropictus)]USS94772.1 30S ribosomal protein S8 [Buchnera aphidicola (Periphyllus lyropictus)]
MSINDPISDMFVRIKNGQRANKISVKMPFSNFKKKITELLKKEGYIESFIVKKSLKSVLEIFLKYFNGKPVIDQIKRISKPGLRVYKSHNEIPKVMSGLGIAIISTSIGILSDRKAREKGVGGEIIGYIS